MQPTKTAVTKQILQSGKMTISTTSFARTLLSLLLLCLSVCGVLSQETNVNYTISTSLANGDDSTGYATLRVNIDFDFAVPQTPGDTVYCFIEYWLKTPTLKSLHGIRSTVQQVNVGEDGRRFYNIGLSTFGNVQQRRERPLLCVKAPVEVLPCWL